MISVMRFAPAVGAWRVAVAVLPALLVASPTHAHWCNNIWSAPARLVVKPEKSTLVLSDGSPTALRVYLRNNFPYTVFNVRMRGDASGYEVGVEPPSQTIHAGQSVAYTFTITPSGGPTGDVDVSNLDLQVNFRVGDPAWRGAGDCLVDDSPGEALLINGSTYGGPHQCDAPSQAASLAVATLADRFPNTRLPDRAPFFGRTGIQQLIHYFGYRFCYNDGGAWACFSENCPSPCAEGTPWNSLQQFAHHCMRAGVELGIRRPLLSNGDLQAAREGAVNALRGGSDQHKCIAAVVGGHLWSGAADTSPFTSALASNDVPGGCQAAGRRALDGSDASSCDGGAYYERAACAAAEGLRGNFAPVTGLLMPQSGDGQSSGDWPQASSLYYAYMLYLVAGHYRNTSGSVPFYPQAGEPPTPDGGSPPRADGSTSPPGDNGSPIADGLGGSGEVGGRSQDEAGARTADATPGGGPAMRDHTLSGGCALNRASPPVLMLLVLVMLVSLRIARRRS